MVVAGGVSDHVWSLEKIAMLADTPFVLKKRRGARIPSDEKGFD